MKDNDIPLRVGENAANIDALQKSDNEQDARILALESAKIIQDLAIAKCTAIWGFIIMVATVGGGFISYNFIKVKLAIIAGFKAFNGS